MRKNYLIPVENDLYEVAQRLKGIDYGYYLLLNKKTGKYEVHNSVNVGNSLAFVVPFDELDARTVDYAQKTRRQNIDKLIAEMDEHNKRIEQLGTQSIGGID